MELTIQEMQNKQLEILRIFVDACEKNNISYLLCAGNALGAIRHGGPIPWDPDTDILVPENQINKLCECMIPELAPDYTVSYHLLGDKSNLIFPRIIIVGHESTFFHIDIFRLVGLPDNKEEQERMYKSASLIIKILELKERSILSIESSAAYKSAIKVLLKLPLIAIPYGLLLRRYNKLCSKYPYDEAPYAGYLSGKYGTRNMFKREMFEEYITVDYAGIAVRIVKEYDFYLRQLYGDYMRLPSQEEQESWMKKIFIVKGKKG